MFEKFLDKIDKLDEDGNNKKTPKNKKEESTGSINWIGMALDLLSILIAIIGIIWGLVIINENEMGLVIIVSSIISALFIRALAEIINLLQDISDKLEK